MKRRMFFLATLIPAVALVSFVAVYRLRSQQLVSVSHKSFTVQMFSRAEPVPNPEGKFKDRHFFIAGRSDGSRAEGNFTVSPDGSHKMQGRRITSVPDK